MKYIEIREMDLNGFLGPRSTDHSFNAFNKHFILQVCQLVSGIRIVRL